MSQEVDMDAAMDSTTASGRAEVMNGSALGRDVRPATATIAPYQRFADQDRGTGGESLADFLGLFSVGLGLAQVTMPGVISRACGIDHEDDRNRTVMRLLGLREISHGLAILTNQQPAKPVWSRVIGDMLDLALLGKAFSNPRNNRAMTVFATANVLAVTALDVMCARQLSEQPDGRLSKAAEEGVIRTRRSITIGRQVDDVFAYWRNVEHLPRFMRHLESVTDLGNGRSHWVAKAPAGERVEWDAEITSEVPNELIAWRSIGDADVYNAGTVRFLAAPGGRGTEVRVDLEYDPPLGKLGSKVAMFWREEPGQQVQDDLRRLKQMLEIGEIVLSDATSPRRSREELS
jgi:uncharacterized membrane protein